MGEETQTKTCAPCLLSAAILAATCPACGEASWIMPAVPDIAPTGGDGGVHTPALLPPIALSKVILPEPEPAAASSATVFDFVETQLASRGLQVSAGDGVVVASAADAEALAGESTPPEELPSAPEGAVLLPPIEIGPDGNAVMEEREAPATTDAPPGSESDAASEDPGPTLDASEATANQASADEAKAQADAEALAATDSSTSAPRSRRSKK